MDFHAAARLRLGHGRPLQLDHALGQQTLDLLPLGLVHEDLGDARGIAEQEEVRLSEEAQVVNPARYPDALAYVVL